MKTGYQQLSPKPIRIVAGCFLVLIVLVSLQASSHAALPRLALSTSTPPLTGLGVTRQPSHIPISSGNLLYPQAKHRCLSTLGFQAAIFDAYLGGKGSPLAGTGATHVAAGQYYLSM